MAALSRHVDRYDAHIAEPLRLHSELFLYRHDSVIRRVDLNPQN